MEQEEPLPPETIQGVLELGRLSLAFGRVDRVTKHEDGEMFESDTDHTVMLGLIAVAYAERFAPHLDRGAIAQFALVHDLVEAYAGDTPTAHILTEIESKEKEEREAAALQRLHDQFDGIFPWIADTIEQYERLDTPEACFVKFVDKVLPKITHTLNSGAALPAFGMDKEKTEQKHAHQFESIVATYGADQPEVRRLYADLSKVVRSTLFGS